MKRFVEGTDRGQTTLFPECLEDWIGEDNAVRVVDVFVDRLAQILFGTDDPYRTAEKHVTGLRKCGFDQDGLLAIEQRNAVALMPTLASYTPQSG